MQRRGRGTVHAGSKSTRPVSLRATNTGPQLRHPRSVPSVVINYPRRPLPFRFATRQRSSLLKFRRFKIANSLESRRIRPLEEIIDRVSFPFLFFFCPEISRSFRAIKVEDIYGSVARGGGYVRSGMCFREM